MKSKFKCICLTDVHNQQSMLDYPTTLRESMIKAVEYGVEEFGKFNLAIVGGDNVSDYPYWNKSCALPKKNFLDIKQKIVDCTERATIDGKVLYVAGNNDMILGDIGTEENLPYNTTEFYYTGPMIDRLGKLDDSELFTVKSIEKPHEHPYLNAFHYVINGIDFIGINIDPNTAFNSHDGYYTEETIDWIDSKLNEIDTDKNKLIFVIGHLSLYYRTNLILQKSKIENTDKLIEVLSKHKNLFYLYGHVHGENHCYTSTSQAVLFLDENGKVLESPNGSTATLVQMGGLRAFNPDSFEKDGLTGYGGDSEKAYHFSTGTCKLSQYLVFEVFNDRVRFSLRNTGNLENYEKEFKPQEYDVFLK